MGRKAPIGIKDMSDLEPGNYLGNVEDFGEKFSKEKNLLMYGLQIGVLAPAERVNRKHFINFVIGTEEDPQAELPATWQEKAGQLKQFCKAVGVPLEGEDLDIVTQHVMRKNFCFRIEHRPGKGDFAGRTFVNVQKWALEGTMAPGLDAIGTAVAPTMSTAPIPQMVAPVAPSAPVAPVPLQVVPPAPPIPAPANPTQGTETEQPASYPFPPPPGAAA